MARIFTHLGGCGCKGPMPPHRWVVYSVDQRNVYALWSSKLWPRFGILGDGDLERVDLKRVGANVVAKPKDLKKQLRAIGVDLEKRVKIDA